LYNKKMQFIKGEEAGQEIYLCLTGHSSRLEETTGGEWKKTYCAAFEKACNLSEGRIREETLRNYWI
jgi:hypothetical protein